MGERQWHWFCLCRNETNYLYPPADCGPPTGVGNWSNLRIAKHPRIISPIYKSYTHIQSYTRIYIYICIWFRIPKLVVCRSCSSHLHVQHTKVDFDPNNPPISSMRCSLMSQDLGDPTLWPESWCQLLELLSHQTKDLAQHLGKLHQIAIWIYMGISWTGGSPKSSIQMRSSMVNHPLIGVSLWKKTYFPTQNEAFHLQWEASALLWYPVPGVHNTSPATRYSSAWFGVCCSFPTHEC